MSLDPGLEFWLHYVDARGGLTERAGDGTLVMLPPAVAGELDVPDEVVVTADPDIARDDGMMLLSTGHPVLVRAADTALTEGDAGIVALAPPTTPAPAQEQLQDRLREQVDVEHGRIDVTGLPVRVDRPVLRVGALVTYTVSAEDSFQERLETWVDTVSGLPLGDDDVRRLQRTARVEGATRVRSSLLVDAVDALDDAHDLLDAAAQRRRVTLSTQASHAHQQERAYAGAYYDDALRSLERRRGAADPDRAALLIARAASTREERTRRLLEIDEKYQARHEIRPFRLHVVLVPGWRIPVDILRGPRRHPFTYTWLPALGAFAAERCPHCGATARPSVSKARLGCRSCLAPAG